MGDRVDELISEVSRLSDQLEDDENLEETDPRDAYELWMQQLDRADSTLQSYQYRIEMFLDFCEEHGITSLDQLTSRSIKEFEASRRASGIEPQTLKNQLGTLKQYLEYCEDIDAVSGDTRAAVDVPSLSKDERINTEKLVAERAKTILEQMDRFVYASREHTTFLLLWRTTVRIGTLYALDLEDVYLNEDDRDRLRVYLSETGYSPEVVEEILAEAELPFVYPRNRPETGTRLKNGDAGERVINITDWVADVIRAYINVNRADRTDDHGRKPLLTTRKGNGRLSKSSIRNWIYVYTQPCEFGGPCPHDRDPETCEAREHGKGSKCPSSRSPHKLRTGSITWHRDQGWPLSDLSDKANAGEDLIKSVYDQPEKLVRGASRRQHLDKLDQERDTQ